MWHSIKKYQYFFRILWSSWWKCHLTFVCWLGWTSITSPSFLNLTIRRTSITTNLIAIITLMVISYPITAFLYAADLFSLGRAGQLESFTTLFTIISIMTLKAIFSARKTLLFLVLKMTLNALKVICKCVIDWIFW